MTEDRPKIRITDKRPGRPDDVPAADGGIVEPEAGQPDVEELARLADDRLDQLMRLKADFENFRKREMREKTELIDRASLRIVERLLPVIDDLERALDAAAKHAKDLEGSEAIVRGVELVHRKLHEVLVEEGLERVSGEGEFDPEHHEAVASVPGDVTEPTILEIVRPGYKLKGKTIRPALVQVEVPKERGPQGGD